MLLRNIKIENYRSLKRIEMSRIDNLVILVGKNSSGKTNLLESLWLFFKDFSLVPETVPISATLDANELIWFEGDTNFPITFIADIELGENESKKIFPTDLLQTFSDQGKSSIMVERQIVATPPNMSWKTISLSCNGISLIENGKIITPKLSNPIAPSNTKTPAQNTKNAERPKITKLATEKEKETVIKTKVLEKLKPEDVQKITTNLQSEIHEKVKYIPASRSKTWTPSNYAVRTTTTDDTTNQKVIEMGENLSTKVRRRWRRLQEDFENFSSYGQRLNVVRSKVIVDETDLSIPLYLVGGGTQEIVNILRHIKENGKPIVLIEEPENHLHPDLAKKLFKYLKKLSKNMQIWISTQSPFFLNRNEIDNTWTVSRENNETKILRLMDKVELKKTILELGVKPGDLLFADALLLVEGTTEEDVIPEWARTLGIDLDELGISILSIRGAEKGKYCLKMWKEITRSAQIPLFILLDAHARDEAQELIEQGLIDRDRCVVLNVTSIEENYPKKYVLKAIKEEWGIQMSSSELENTKAETIKNALEEKGMKLNGNWWKPVLGRRVAKMMKVSEIPDETRRLIERVKLVLI